MDLFTKLFLIISVIGLFLSLKFKYPKTKEAVHKSKNMMSSMILEIIGVILLIGLILTFIPPTTIKTFLGGDNLVFTTLICAILGSITLIPAFVAFPLIGSLMQYGASIIPVVAFLTTLTMVGVVTFPLEKREFGLQFALYRNIGSFILAIIIALVMGVII